MKGHVVVSAANSLQVQLEETRITPHAYLCVCQL